MDWVERILLFLFFRYVSADPENKLPRMLSTSSNLNVLEGSSVLLPCNVLNLERKVRIWKQLPTRILFSGSISVSRDPKISLINSSSLQIDDITPEYSGEYICQISHHPLLVVTHKLNVLVPPLIIPDPPNGKVIAKKGSSITMMCNTTGIPKPAVTWSFSSPGVWFTGLPHGVRQVQGYQLQIASVDVDHAGLYTCRADNEVGSAVEAIFNLTVLYAPEVIVKPEWIHGDEGATVEFHCTSKAAPLAQVSWVRGSPKSELSVQQDKRVTTWEEVTQPSTREVWLKIQRIRKEDLGPYSCLAKNSVGQTWKTVEVSGLAEPVQLRGNESGDHSFLLVWNAKSYSPIIEYQLKIRKHKSGDEWTDVMIPVSEEQLQQTLFFSQSYNITGLERSTKYEAVLQAHNNYGWNRPSETFFFSIGPVESAEESTVLTLLPLYDAELDITDPTYLKQDSAANSIAYSSILFFLLLLVSCLQQKYLSYC